MKIDITYIIKTSFLYGVLAASFSLIGILLLERQFLDDPITGGLDIVHIGGHVVWGLMAGAASLRLRYFILAGSLAIMIDSDHFIQLLNIEAIGRMGHSIPFAFFSAVIMMLVFGKKDYLLGGVVFSAMLAHIAFDTYTGSGNFPLFTPFYNELIRFQNADWIFFELGAVIIIGLLMMKTKLMNEKTQQKVS